MALSKPTSPDDRTRFFRLGLVIIEELTPVLQDVLTNEIPSSQIFTTVKQNKRLFKKLGGDQIDKINNAKTQGYKDFDITLLYTLLRNLCPNIPEPTKGWGISVMPEHSETTVGDDIERIRLIRNNVYGHISVLSISETDFKEYWRTISDICNRMQVLLGKNYIQSLQNAEGCTIDSTAENMYMYKIKDLIESEKSTRELLQTVIKEKELTSKETVKIETKNPEKRKFRDELTETSIYILNVMVENIHEMSTESDIEELYEAIEDFIREDTEDSFRLASDPFFRELRRKIRTYANLQEENTMKILSRFLRFTLKLKKNYNGFLVTSEGSLLLMITFTSDKGYNLYKQDKERGEIGQQILEVLLYPPYLASFHLKAEDLVVYLNDQKLIQNQGDVLVLIKESDIFSKQQMESENSGSVHTNGSEAGQREKNRTTDNENSPKRPSDFKTICNTDRQPALIELYKEKQHEENSCDHKQSTQTLGTKAVYQKKSPDSAKKRNIGESSDDKENSGGTKSCRRKFDYTQVVYKKGATLFSILELDCADSSEPEPPKIEPLTLNKKISQLVPFSRQKSTYHQFDQTMYYSCTPEQLSLHKLRCSIYSSLGASWSIVNPDECKRVCFQCFHKHKVESMLELTPGDHITIHRSVGYEHHAIVVEVSPDEDDHTSGFLRVIHYSANAGEVAKGILPCMITVGQYGNLAYLREEDVKFDLKKQDVYIIQYKNKHFTHSKIIRRARAKIENEETLYSISSDNCEHFANWCATGEYYSHQIGLLKATLQMLLVSDNEAYNRMLSNLAENGIMCDECFKEAKRAQEERRLNQEKAEENSLTHMLP